MKRLQEMRRRAEEYVSSIRQEILNDKVDVICGEFLTIFHFLCFASTSGHSLVHYKIFQAKSTLMPLIKKMLMLSLLCTCTIQ